MSIRSSSTLEGLLRQRFAINNSGGFRARLARLSVMHWLVLQRFHARLWVQCPLFCGQRMWVLTGEATSRGLLAFGYSELALTALMLRVLRPGMRVSDVGAHFGYEALLACMLVGESGRVTSFEPQPKVAEATSRNLKRFPQARLVRSAVADYAGTLEFDELPLESSAFAGGSRGLPAGRLITVPVTTLSEALGNEERPVDFLKVDVEGAEMSVLRGAQEVLKRDRPLLVVEAEMPSENPARPRVLEFCEFLAPLGYLAFSFDFDGELKIAPLGELEVGHANVAFLPLARDEFRYLLPE